MQDIDFVKMYRKSAIKKGHRGEKRNGLAQKSSSQLNINKILYCLSTGIISFTIGLYYGIKLESSINQPEFQSQIKTPEMEISSKKGEDNSGIKFSNVAESSKNSDVYSDSNFQNTSEPSKKTSNPPPSSTNFDSSMKNRLKSSEKSFIILARIYKDEKIASLRGLKLKRKGLPAFMARSGDKIKVYVGPIQGRNQAYQALAQVKSLEEFSGAIMYQK